MNDSFLPAEYTEQRVDRRTHILAFLLFAVVMTAVCAAFFWKRDQWKQVERIRQDVELRYQAAGAEVGQLLALKESQQATVHKAELAAALVEKVPRSILLAELINSMPTGLGLHAMRLESSRILPEPPAAATGGRKSRAAPRSPAASVQPLAPVYTSRLALTGFAPTDVHVSEFLAALNAHPLLTGVNLVSSQETTVEDRMIREFKLTAQLKPSADVRELSIFGTATELIPPAREGPADE